MGSGAVQNAWDPVISALRSVGLASSTEAGLISMRSPAQTVPLLSCGRIQKGMT
jgi:hypothetical protein